MGMEYSLVLRSDAAQKRRQHSITRKSIFPVDIGAYCLFFLDARVSRPIQGGDRVV